MLPLATAADFLATRAASTPAPSWLRAVRELGGAQADALRAFAETNYSTHLDYGTEAPTFVAARDRLLADYEAGGRWPERRAALDDESTRVDSAEAALRRAPSLAPFVVQAAPFLDASRVAAGAGACAARCSLPSARRWRSSGPRRACRARRAARPGRRRRAARRADRRDADNRASRRFVFGYRRPATVDTPPTPLPPNTMDVFVDRVRSLDQASAGRATGRLVGDGRARRPAGGARLRRPLHAPRRRRRDARGHRGAGGSTTGCGRRRAPRRAADRQPPPAARARPARADRGRVPGAVLGLRARARARRTLGRAGACAREKRDGAAVVVRLRRVPRRARVLFPRGAYGDGPVLMEDGVAYTKLDLTPRTLRRAAPRARRQHVRDEPDRPAAAPAGPHPPPRAPGGGLPRARGRR